MSRATSSAGRREPTRWLTPLSWPFDRGVVLSDLALLATVVAVLLMFALSPVTLESFGISYLTSGGGIFSKLHPSTVLALVAIGLRCLASRRPLNAAWRITTEDSGVVLMIGAIAIAAGYAAVISHLPVTPMIDTFILPVLTFLLLRDLDPIVKQRLALCLILLFCVNAVLAMLEVIEHKHFPAITVAIDASPDPTRGTGTFDWRAQLSNDSRAVALLGHPLTGGLLTGALIICFVSRGTRWLPAIVKIPALLLQALAMGTFGARTAFVLTILAVVFVGGKSCVDGVRKGRRLSARTAAIALATLAFLALGVVIVLNSGLLDQTIDRFQHDSGSATTRITMFDLFTPLSTSDILLGPDPAVVATQQRIEGLEFGIESSWVGLALNYGVVVAAIIITGLAAFAHSVWRASGKGAGIVLFYFFIQVTSAASLSTKTTVLAMTVALLLTILQRDGDSRLRCRSRFGVA